MYRLPIVLLLILTSLFVSSQTSQLTVGSSTTNQVFNEVKFDPSDQSTISVGYLRDQSNGNGNDCFIVKLNSSHQIVWQRIITNPGNDNLVQVVICANGDYVAAGGMTVNGILRGFVCRIDKNSGNIIWSSVSSSTNSPSGDFFYDVFETVNGNIALGGVNDNTPGSTNSFVTLLSSAGAFKWGRVSTFSQSDEYFSLVQLPNNNLLLCGTYNSGSSYPTTLMELDENTANVVSQNEYVVNTNLPGVGLALNSAWPIKAYVKNGSVILYLSLFQGFSSDSYQSFYIYDPISKNLTGNIYYHPGLLSAIAYTFYPISSSDFIFSQSFNNTSVVVSRVTAGATTYDRKVNNTVTSINGMNVLNSNLAFCGSLSGSNQSAYGLFSDISFPASNSQCSITDLNTLSSKPYNINASATSVINLIPINAMVSFPTNSVASNVQINSLCGCVPAIINNQPGNTTVCANANAVFSVGASNATSYQWQVNTGSSWVDLNNNAIYSGTSGSQLSITSTNVSMNNYQYRVLVNSSCNSVTSSPAILTVNPTLTPTINIVSSLNNICSGTNVTFTASGTNGGNTPTYQWTKNGNNVGPNNNIYNDNSLANGDIINVIFTSNATCATPVSVTSNSIKMVVTQVVTTSVSITGSANNICPNTAVIFTASPVNGGSSPTYQWTKNGINVGVNSSTYSDNNIQNGDIIKTTLNSNATCASPVSAASNSISMVVNPTVTPSVSINANANNICPGTNVSFTATPTNGGAAPSYQWMKNNVNAGTNSNIYNDNNLNNGDVIKVILTSSANCTTTPTATSNSITMSVTASPTPSVTIISSSNKICPGDPVMFTATSVNGGSSPSYQWLKNGINVGTNSSTYSDNSLNNGDLIKVTMTSSGGCSSSVTSNIITMIVLANQPSVRYKDVIVAINQPVQLHARPMTSANYLWKPPNGLDNPSIADPVFNYGQQQEYTISISVSGSCPIVDTLLVKVFSQKEIFVPKAFSPNGDGNNDRLYPILIGIKSLNYFKIFNRWGNLLFQMNDANPANGWDGIFNGIKQPVETYTWIAEGVDIDGKIIKRGGNTLLIR